MWVGTYTLDSAQASTFHLLLTEKFRQRGDVVIQDTPFSNNGRFTLYGTAAPGTGIMVNLRRLAGGRPVLVVTGPYSVLNSGPTVKHPSPSWSLPHPDIADAGVMHRLWMAVSVLVTGVALAASPGDLDLRVGDRWTVQFGATPVIPFTLERVSGPSGRRTATAQVIRREDSEVMIVAALIQTPSGAPGLAVSALERFDDGVRRTPIQYCVVLDFTPVSGTPPRYQGEWSTRAISAIWPRTKGRCVIQAGR